MELLWILFVTLIAVGAAYVIGGRIDRQAQRRQEELARGQRREWLRQAAQFSQGFAAHLGARTLIPAHLVPAAARELARYILEWDGETIGDGDWEAVEAALAAPEDANPS